MRFGYTPNYCFPAFVYPSDFLFLSKGLNWGGMVIKSVQFLVFRVWAVRFRVMSILPTWPCRLSHTTIEKTGRELSQSLAVQKLRKHIKQVNKFYYSHRDYDPIRSFWALIGNRSACFLAPDVVLVNFRYELWEKNILEANILLENLYEIFF